MSFEGKDFLRRILKFNHEWQDLGFLKIYNFCFQTITLESKKASHRVGEHIYNMYNKGFVAKQISHGAHKEKIQIANKHMKKCPLTLVMGNCRLN